MSGDWNNDGTAEIGVFRPSTHLYYQDYNGNGVWNGPVTDRAFNFGITGDIPVSGDWNNDGTDEIGVFRPSTHLYYQDYNGNGVWNGPVTDRAFSFGITGDIPLSGDWNNDGTSEIGVFRPSTHLFYQDYNGNGVWNGPVTDRAYQLRYHHRHPGDRVPGRKIPQKLFFYKSKRVIIPIFSFSSCLTADEYEVCLHKSGISKKRSFRINQILFPIFNHPYR